VTFSSSASNLVTGDTNDCTYNPTCPDVFLRDLLTGGTIRVSVDSLGAQGLYALSAQGSTHSVLVANLVGFTSDATNLISGDSNNSDDVFVHTLADTDSDLEWDPFDVCPEAADCDGDSFVPPGYTTCVACPRPLQRPY
jgi:hypothetical protein